ncbi:peptide-methionine (S)-S-oxide reductase MsrA [Candidatus Curtissbacteria bacterium]|nr:peptide-methionine (S)-S-oxide reductase MsrA [Candidatus Curtissbacteria bacterium]
MAKVEKATLAGGCFWCTEAIFRRLRGVVEVVAGYSGGEVPSPTYEAVHGSATGYAEAIQITFDPKVVSYETLLEVFFKLYDPTTLDRQGADVGSEYRSVIFYGDDNQKKSAQKVKAKIEKLGMYEDPIVTEIVPYETFYKAEGNHQKFYEKNRLYPYCQIVIDPKISKLYADFGELVED